MGDGTKLRGSQKEEDGYGGDWRWLFRLLKLDEMYVPEDGSFILSTVCWEQVEQGVLRSMINDECRKVWDG